jgi:hypothetical protein
MLYKHGEFYLYMGDWKSDQIVGIGNLGNIRFTVGKGSEYLMDSPAVRDEYTLYCLTYSSGSMVAYRNGKLVGVKSASLGHLSGSGYLGRHSWREGSSTRLVAVFDEVMIWDRVLSENEVRQLYKMQGGLAAVT